MSSEDDVKSLRKTLNELNIQREVIETEAQAITNELNEGENPIGVHTPLVDKEGFPRGDIDLYRARSLRHRLNELRTNHKEIMKRVEDGLHKLAAVQSGTNVIKEETKKKKEISKPKFNPETGMWTFPNSVHEESSSQATVTTNTTSNDVSEPSIPFALIDSVAQSSPASEAGLHTGDLVVQFGKATYTNHNNLKLVAESVAQAAKSKGSILIHALRRKKATHDQIEAGIREKVSIEITPRPWGGRGLLGCHIVLYNEVTEANYNEPSC